ncbi:MAG TPA: cyclodeaminase/cyclohydrolase family protein, partial [Bacteroidia bacterium]|nr:cyclodeaminase/cyclohydrolase family protein [Bacteroidia bacterium]
QAMLDAGKYFLNKQRLSSGVSDAELIHIAVKSMGLDELSPFTPEKRIIEYVMESESKAVLANMRLNAFVDETASESPAPGGGSIAAYCGSLGVALATMVANLSASKKGWEERWNEFSDWADKGQKIKKQLLHLVDEDTVAFNKIMDAFKLPKATDQEKEDRKQAVAEATRYAIEVPLSVMKISLQSMELIEAMATNGNPNSVSDAGVGAMCARTAVLGAGLNVRINAAAYSDKTFVETVLKQAAEMENKAIANEKNILDVVNRKISGL